MVRWESGCQLHCNLYLYLYLYFCIFVFLYFCIFVFVIFLFSWLLVASWSGWLAITLDHPHNWFPCHPTLLLWLQSILFEQLFEFVVLNTLLIRKLICILSKKKLPLLLNLKSIWDLRKSSHHHSETARLIKTLCKNVSKTFIDFFCVLFWVGFTL